MITGPNELFPPWTLLATALDLHEVDQKGYFSIFMFYQAVVENNAKRMQYICFQCN